MLDRGKPTLSTTFQNRKKRENNNDIKSKPQKTEVMNEKAKENKLRLRFKMLFSNVPWFGFFKSLKRGIITSRNNSSLRGTINIHSKVHASLASIFQEKSSCCRSKMNRTDGPTSPCLRCQLQIKFFSDCWTVSWSLTLDIIENVGTVSDHFCSFLKPRHSHPHHAPVINEFTLRILASSSHKSTDTNVHHVHYNSH